MSKIILCCPFFNENLIANLNIEEASKWVDEIHVTEFDKSFKYKLHEHCFHNRNEKVYITQWMHQNYIKSHVHSFLIFFFIL